MLRAEGTRAAIAGTRAHTQCSICLDTFSAPVLTPCGHRFCEACICTALKLKKQCPTCRKDIKGHRELRADTQFASLVGSKLPNAMEAGDLVAAAESTWACPTCTLDNPVAAGRCMACGARRPSKVTSVQTIKSYVDVEEEDDESSDEGSCGSETGSEHGSEYCEDDSADEEAADTLADRHARARIAARKRTADSATTSVPESEEVLVLQAEAVRDAEKQGGSSNLATDVGASRKRPLLSHVRSSATQRTGGWLRGKWVADVAEVDGRPFWMRAKNGRRGIPKPRIKGWSAEEDAVIMEAIQVAKAGCGGKRTVTQMMPDRYWDDVLPKLPGRTLTGARKRLKRLMERLDNPRAPVEDVEVYREWPQKPSDWVDSKLWAGASASGWAVFCQRNHRYVWVHEPTGKVYAQRAMALAIHEEELQEEIRRGHAAATGKEVAAVPAVEETAVAAATATAATAATATAAAEWAEAAQDGLGAAERAELPSEWDGYPLVLSSTNSTGYQNVSYNTRGLSKPYQVRVERQEGKKRIRTIIGWYVSALEGAVAYSRYIGKERARAESELNREMDARRSRYLTLEEAERTAAAEGLTLVHDKRTKTGLHCVVECKRNKHLPFKATYMNDGQKAALRTFASAPEAALAVARYLGPERSHQMAQRILELAAMPGGWWRDPALRRARNERRGDGQQG